MRCRLQGLGPRKFLLSATKSMSLASLGFGPQEPSYCGKRGWRS